MSGKRVAGEVMIGAEHRMTSGTMPLQFKRGPQMFPSNSAALKVVSVQTG